ncbi:MAG: hypothetical protein GYB68_13200 [Chloroflexi bacterium]|nr:hypothetical protein [Chloroflexota bacterium]
MSLDYSEKTPAPNDLPNWLWDVVQRVFISAMLGLVVMILMVLAGVGEQPPLGGLELDQRDTLRIHALAGAHLTEGPSYPVDLPGSIELHLRLQGGPADAGYGMQIEAGEETIVWLLNGNRLQAFMGLDALTLPVRSWRPFPHVRPAGELNRLRIDASAERLRLWLNDEVALDLAYGDIDRIEVTPVIDADASEDVTLAVERLRVWREKPAD